MKFEGFLNDDCSGTDLDEDVEAVKIDIPQLMYKVNEEPE